MSAVPPPHTVEPRSAAAVMAHLVATEPMGAHNAPKAVPTGFDPLDRELGGGLLPGTLTLVGGMPGVGKTVAALQWARNIAMSGQTCIYACYEHDERELLLRLMALEIAEVAHADNAPAMEKLRMLLREAAAGHRNIGDLVATEALVAAAHERLAGYGDNLVLVKGAGSYHGVGELTALAEAHERPVLIVDYLQKVAVRPEPENEAAKVTRVTEGLKDCALREEIPIVALVAADRASLDARRLRLHHLRGSSALAYESDVVIMLNDKRQAVSKVHLAYDPVRAEGFKHYAVFTIEKNRHGAPMIDMEFRKDFANYRFDPRGGFVAERLLDERLEEA
jgi:replicative DNA helicase